MESLISPYYNSFGLQFDNQDISLERVPYTYAASSDDEVHTILEGETIQNVANQYYGDSGYWYIIADSNPNLMFNPIVDFKPGLQIIIPHGRQ